MLDMLKVNNIDAPLVFLLSILKAVDFEHLIPTGFESLFNNLYHIKISPSFYMIRGFTERYFRIDCNRFSSNF